MGAFLTAISSLNLGAILPWLVGIIGVVWGAIMHLSGKKATAEAQAAAAKLETQAQVANALAAQKEAENKAAAADAVIAASIIPDEDLDAQGAAMGVLRTDK